MITRAEILANALLWPFRTVPYAQWGTASPTGHRPDCSGYVSMCLGLPAPGLSTVSLRSLVDPITVSELLPGDLLGNLGPGTDGDAGHVQVFEGWAPSGGVIVLEQNGIGPGPQRNTFSTLMFPAWRFRGVEEEMDEEVKMWIHNAVAIATGLANGADSVECRYAWTGDGHTIGDTFTQSLKPYWSRLAATSTAEHHHTTSGPLA